MYHKRVGAPMNKLYVNLDAYLNSGHHRPVSESQVDEICRGSDSLLVKTHLDVAGYDSAIEALRSSFDEGVKLSTVYVYRDCRAVMASLQAFEKRYNPNAYCSLSEFIRQENSNGVNRVEEWAQHVGDWLTVPEVIPVRFEHLKGNSAEVIKMLGDSIQQEPLLRTPLLPPPWKNIWACRILGRLQSAPRATTVMGRHKGAKPVSWREALKQDDLDFIRKYAGDLMLRLDYDI
jgi:hypothetical protein